MLFIIVRWDESKKIIIGIVNKTNNKNYLESFVFTKVFYTISTIKKT